MDRPIAPGPTTAMRDGGAGGCMGCVVHRLASRGRVEGPRIIHPADECREHSAGGPSR